MLAVGSHIVHFVICDSVVNFMVCIPISNFECLFTSYLHVNMINSTVKNQFQYSVIHLVFGQI
jgi:hypothetical protein